MKEKLLDLLRLQAQGLQENLSQLGKLISQANQQLDDQLVLELEAGTPSVRSGRLLTELCRLEDSRQGQELALRNLLQQCKAHALYGAIRDSY